MSKHCFKSKKEKKNTKYKITYFEPIRQLLAESFAGCIKKKSVWVNCSIVKNTNLRTIESACGSKCRLTISKTNLNKPLLI